MAPVFVEIGEVMRRPLVIGNWKMHGTKAVVSELLGGLQKELAGLSNVDVAVCPPYLYIPAAMDLSSAGLCAVGAQNLCAEESDQGAYTGEISAAMLQDSGCSYVLVGHSERREYYAESDGLVAEKFVIAQKAGLVPVFCVGESLQQRESGQALQFISAQLDAVLEKAGIASMREAVIAYEPIWAIGTGRTASPEQAQEVHEFIRGRLAALDEDVAKKTRILYGGSVKADNAVSLFAKPDIDGALVGGASLKAGEFAAICRATE